ncbi:MAG: hypothetical protein LBV04_09115 [Deferribacteraceae bacterium]|jgi:hypothetical protein|nr:hypothetical protein [Deferribacteraceae bacterium]
MNIMIKHIYIIIIVCMLTACGPKSQTFYFDSNKPNVEIRMSAQVDDSCYTPCKLKLIPDDEDNYFFIRDYNYSESGIIETTAHGFKDYDGEYFPDVAFKHLIRGYDNGIVSISSPAFTTTDLTSITSDAIVYVALIRYDTNAYYIYVSESELYAFSDPDFLISQYVLTNFEQMRAELFATKQPLIAGLAKLIAAAPYKPANIEELLLQSTDAASFLNALIQSSYRMEPIYELSEPKPKAYCLDGAPEWVINKGDIDGKLSAVGVAPMSKSGIPATRLDAIGNARDALVSSINADMPDISVDELQKLRQSAIPQKFWFSPCDEVYVLLTVALVGESDPALPH